MDAEVVVTLTHKCEVGLHAGCRRLVVSMTGNRVCECPCHEEEAQ